MLITQKPFRSIFPFESALRQYKEKKCCNCFKFVFRDEKTFLDSFCPCSFSLIMCFYVIAKLVFKMPFPQQLFLSLGQFMSIYVETAEGTFQNFAFCHFAILQPFHNNLSSKLVHPLELILTVNFI